MQVDRLMFISAYTPTQLERNHTTKAEEHTPTQLKNNNTTKQIKEDRLYIDLYYRRLEQKENKLLPLSNLTLSRCTLDSILSEG